MKKLIFAVVLSLIPTVSFSGETGTVTSIHTYRSVEQREDFRRVCDRHHRDNSDILLGAIIGGALGGELSGTSEGTILGAIVGGSIMSENRPSAKNCRYVKRHNNVLNEYHEVVVRTSNGNYKAFTTTQHLEIGDIVHLQ